MWTWLYDFVTSPWIYAAVTLLIALDVFLPFMPSGTLLIVATVYAVTTGGTSELILLACAVAASVGSDFFLYSLAKRGSGRFERWLSRLPRLSRVDNRLRTVLEQRTGQTTIFARFMPAGRSVVSVLAGTDVTGSIRRFRMWSVLAGVTWASYTVGLGYINALLFQTTWISIVTGSCAFLAISALMLRIQPKAIALPTAKQPEADLAEQVADTV